MRNTQTILSITKIEPAHKPRTSLLTFKQAHEAKAHLDAYFTSEKQHLAKQIEASADAVPLIPKENTYRQRIITQQSGEQSFDILANHYHVAWLKIEGDHHVNDEELQSCLDGYVNSCRTASEYATIAESITKTMHRYCQNELWKLVKAIIKAFAHGGHDNRNKTAANQALELQTFIENNPEF